MAKWLALSPPANKAQDQGCRKHLRAETRRIWDRKAGSVSNFVVLELAEMGGGGKGAGLLPDDGPPAIMCELTSR